MREIIKNIDELSDSREILEAEPHPFVPIFITIVVLLLVAALVWSYFGEIDSVAKATGVVRPNEKVSTIQVPIFGRIEEGNYKEGQQVNKGDRLLSLNQEDVKNELLNRQLDLGDVKSELEFLHTYRESIELMENLFSQELDQDKYYFDLVEQYLLNYEKIKFDIDSSKLELVKLTNELSYSKEMLDINIEENNRSSEQTRKEYEIEKERLEKEISRTTTELENEQKLKTSIENNQLVVPETDKQRLSRFISYQTKLEQLTVMSNEYQTTYERSKELGTRFVSAVQIQQEKKQYETSLLEIEAYINDSQLAVTNQIRDLELQLQQLKLSLNNLEKMIDLTVYNEGLLAQKEHINIQQSDISEQEGMLVQSRDLTLQKYETDKLVEINRLIEEQKNKQNSLQEAIQQLTFAVNKGDITAPISGTVNILKDISVGDIVQSGERIVSIIPVNESKYKMNIAVPNHEVGKIAVGNDVNFHFTAFPKQSYGHLTGKITSISADSFIQQDGFSYYTVEASISNRPLVNRKGEQGEIRVGMTAEIFVITETKKILHYLLEKINFRN